MQVDEYIAKHNWYAVSYPEDGDSEELTHEEMMALLRTAAEKTPAAKGKRAFFHILCGRLLCSHICALDSLVLAGTSKKRKR